MEQRAGGRRRGWRRALVVVLLAAVYAGGIGLYFAAQHGATKYIKNPKVPRDHLAALVRTISIDPSKGDLVLRVEVRPGPGLVGPDGLSVTRPVSLDVIGGNGKASYRYGPGDNISPVDVTIGLSGNYNSYPFDSYNGLFAVIATASSPPSSNQGGAAPPVAPTQVIFDGTLSGYDVKASPMPTERADVNVLLLELSINRAPLTPAFAVLLLVLQALLGAAAAALAVFVWRRQRRVEIPMLTWLAALLFAIVPLRNAMPGAPPIGALVDVLVFFWAVTIIALSLVSVLLRWLRQPPAET